MCIRVPFHRMLLQDMLQPNKEIKQKKGRNENQETGDTTAHQLEQLIFFKKHDHTRY